MNKIDIEEAPVENPSCFKKHKKVITIVGIVVAVLVVVGIILAIIFGTNTSTTTTTIATTVSVTSSVTTQSTAIPQSTVTPQSTATPQSSSTTSTITDNPTTSTADSTTTEPTITEIDGPSRVDCLPWLKGKPNGEIEAECKNQDLCDYSPDDKPEVPSCYYVPEKSRIVVSEPEITDDGLKETYYLSTGDLKKSSNRIKLDIEYLEDTALRFEVIFKQN